MHKNRLIVIDGADGAGKATQTALLVERLQREGKAVETMSFPRYETNVFGQLIKECLMGQRGDFRKDGKVGDFASLDPRIASTLYAADRFEAKPQLQAWLEAGKTVVLDRYVSSNMLHQGSKIVNNEAALREFLAWNDRVEHEVFGLPRPGLIMYLDVPYDVRARLMREGTERGALDMVEKDEQYQMAAEVCAQQLLSALNHWQCIPCTDGGVLRSREEIHQRVYETAAAYLATVD